MSEQSGTTTTEAGTEQIANLGIEHPLLPDVVIRVEVYANGSYEVSERVRESGDIWAICAVNDRTLNGYAVTDYTKGVGA